MPPEPAKKSLMAKLDFPAFEAHLSAFVFSRLFVDVLGWNGAAAAHNAYRDVERGLIQ